MAAFVLGEVPPAPARVLEVGCGDGELALRLAAEGYAVLAVDPEAPLGPIFRRARIEELEATGEFDAVVASRALHHVDDLALAVEKVAEALAPDGVVVIDDFGWERLDPDSARGVRAPLGEWREEHDHLHPSDAMLSELDRRFSRRSFSWEPYLYREARRVVDEAAERRLIEENRLPAIGFRYVGNL